MAGRQFTLDVDDPGVEEALVELYNALRDNEQFWAEWIHQRISTGPEFDFFAFSGVEKIAARDLREALIGLAKVGEVEE